MEEWVLGERGESHSSIAKRFQIQSYELGRVRHRY